MPRLPLVLASLALVSACNDDNKEVGGDAATSPRPGGDDGPVKIAVPTKCDAAKLTALTGAIAATPDAGSDLVAKQLADVCELPEVVREFLTKTQAPTGNPLAGMLSDKIVTALADVCPGANVIVAQAAELPQDDRPALIYDRCNFKRFGLMDKPAWLRGAPSSLVPFYAYQWLLDDNVAEAQARALGTAMLMADRKRWELEGQQLTAIEQPLAAIPAGTVVHLTQSHIVVDGQEVITLAQGEIDEGAVQGYLVSELFDVLAEMADKRKALPDAEGRSSAMVVVADARTPGDTLVKLLYTAGRAEFREFAFVAKTGPAEYGAIVQRPSKTPIGADQGEAAKLELDVSSKGFSVLAVNALGASEIPLTAAGAPDYVALAAAVQKHKTEHAKATKARLSLQGEDVAIGVVLQTLAVLGGAHCDTPKKDCAFSDVSFDVRPARNFDPDMAARQAGILGMLAQDSGHFLASPYGAAFAVDDSEDRWGGLTGSEVGQAFGVGGLGLVGTERGGGGTGEGTIGLGNVGLIGKGGGGGGFGGRGKRVPRVRQAKATVKGGLDKDIVRRIVRAHINEIRSCYETGLEKDAELKGRVTLAFVVGADGKVSSSVVQDKTIDDAGAANCMAKAAKKWKFPRPTDGGTVAVTYPFVLEPG